MCPQHLALHKCQCLYEDGVERETQEEAGEHLGHWDAGCKPVILWAMAPSTCVHTQADWCALPGLSLGPPLLSGTFFSISFYPHTGRVFFQKGSFLRGPSAQILMPTYVLVNITCQCPSLTDPWLCCNRATHLTATPLPRHTSFFFILFTWVSVTIFCIIWAPSKSSGMNNSEYG